MKQLSRVAALFLFLCTCWIQPAAASDIRITLDDQPITFDAAPFIEKDRVLVPVRGILESLGYTVHWQEHTRSVLAMNEDVTITLKIDDPTATVNGHAISVDAPAKIKDGRTFVPLRFLAEYSGADVRWNGGTSTVSIYSREAVSEQMMKRSVVYIQTNKIQGSGIVLSASGVIATNYHVIKDASTAQFIFSDGSIYQGETTIIGLQPEADIAILKINAQYLSPGAISGAYSEGEAVTAIGAPYGQRNTVTTGSILGYNDDIISTTAEIGQGSSGGGLFNSSGKLIGMTSSYVEGNYFAIPITKVQMVPRDLSIPLHEISQYPYEPAAPQNLQVRYEPDGYAYVSWAPLYGADHFCVYYSTSANGSFRPLTSPSQGSNKWYWGYPQCFGLSRQKDDIYLKVTAVVNGQETDASEVLKIKDK